MIMFKPELCSKVVAVPSEKDQTRRPVKEGEEAMTWDSEIIAVLTAKGRTKWALGQSNAIVPGRGKPQVGRRTILHLGKEKLHDITEEDARAEGFASRDEFAAYWKNLYKNNPTISWESNPLVWVIEFEPVK